MPLASMTGFARADGATDGWTITWELRSVNGKGLDIRTRLPLGVDGLDRTVRSRLQQAFARGNITANLQLERDGGEDSYQINQPWLDRLMAIAETGNGVVTPETVAHLLSVRGVIETGQAAPDDTLLEKRDAAVLEVLDEALRALSTARQEEGERLQSVLDGVVNDIEQLHSSAIECDGARPERRRERLQRMLQELLEADPPLTEERLAQELALQMTRGDIAEELDRLSAHVAQARELLGSDEPVGRRLDFLAQEFNREANTLCSKSADVELTRIGMDMKVAIDRMREQVQNIE